LEFLVKEVWLRSESVEVLEMEEQRNRDSFECCDDVAFPRRKRLDRILRLSMLLEPQVLLLLQLLLQRHLQLLEYVRSL
jgi:hypothetical protein